MKKSELKSIIKEVVNEQFDKKQLNEIAFTKKAKWNKLTSQYNGNIPFNIIEKFFNDLFNPENKNLSGNIGQYIKIFRDIFKKTKAEKQSELIYKVLNELPSDDYVLVNITKDQYDKLPVNKRKFAYKNGSNFIYLKGINSDTVINF